MKPAGCRHTLRANPGRSTAEPSVGEVMYMPYASHIHLATFLHSLRENRKVSPPKALNNKAVVAHNRSHKDFTHDSIDR
jgi:hypothetical protein